MLADPKMLGLFVFCLQALCITSSSLRKKKDMVEKGSKVLTGNLVEGNLTALSLTTDQGKFDLVICEFRGRGIPGDLEGGSHGEFLAHGRGEDGVEAGGLGGDERCKSEESSGEIHCCWRFI